MWQRIICDVIDPEQDTAYTVEYLELLLRHNAVLFVFQISMERPSHEYDASRQALIALMAFFLFQHRLSATAVIS